MARTAAFVTLALLVAAAVAMPFNNSDYTEEQIDKLDKRVNKCTEDVPRLGDFDFPGYTCALRGYLAVVVDGVKKEAVTDVVVKCLKSRPLDAGLIAKVEQCLVKAMAKDL